MVVFCSVGELGLELEMSLALSVVTAGDILWILHVPPKTCVLRVWSPAVALLGYGRTFRRWSLERS